MNGFSFRRLTALLRKEWIQVRRDPMTLRLIIALPIMQLFLFGYAINANPKHLPTGLLLGEPSKYERTIVTALQNTAIKNSDCSRPKPRPSRRSPRAMRCS